MVAAVDGCKSGAAPAHSLQVQDGRL